MDGQRTGNIFYDEAAQNAFLLRHRSVVCAVSASYISTFAGYPYRCCAGFLPFLQLDSLKSRLQTQKTPIALTKLAANVYREEGFMGFYRGLWVPLTTISVVRATSFTIFNKCKDWMGRNQYLVRDRLVDVAMTGAIAGSISGSLISFCSAPFELVKIRRQLEYSIAATRGVQLLKVPSNADSVREIFRLYGVRGFWLGFPLHFHRDTLGTALYFLEYDGMRHVMGKSRRAGHGDRPPWFPIPNSLVPFFCGSFAGVTSWALIYPLDVVKTKMQQRSLAGERYRTAFETLKRLIRGPDPSNPRTLVNGITRLYRGLGVSAVRSITTHGLVWTVFHWVEDYINALPTESSPS